MPASEPLSSRARRAALPASAGALGAAALVRRVAPEVHPLSILLTASTPYAFAPAYPLAAAALARRRFGTFAVAAGVAAAHAVWMAPEVRGAFARPAPPPGMPLRVAVANLWVCNRRRMALGEALAKVQADILVLEELKPPFVDEMRRKGLFDAYPYEFLLPRHDPQGIGVCSKIPLQAPREVAVSAATAISAGLDLFGTRAQFWAAHVRAPGSRFGRRLWLEEFRVLGELVGPGPGPLVVAGDFNATMQHPRLRAFAQHAGLTEAHQAVGRGLVTTWPLHRRAVPPFMRLDHVFTRGLAVAGAGEFPIPGSDHRGTVADLVVPARDG